MSQEVATRTRDLSQAFSLFQRVSEQLSSSYRDLEGRVESLSRELAAARDARLVELAEKERLAGRLARLIAALPAGVVVLDGDGRVQECNPAALEFLGAPLQGQPWRAVIARAFSPRPDDGDAVSLRDGRKLSLDTRALGDAPGQIVLLQDVTEARRLQERLERHKRLIAMGEMAAGLAHQIRTPLASAMLYASHLTHPALPPEDRSRYAGRIGESLRHLEKLVNDMLAFARGGGAEKATISVAGLLQGLREFAEPTLQAAECTLAFADEVPDVAVYGNRAALLGALQNLIVNAVQACGPSGRLEVCARAAGNGAIDIIVRDNGPGVPEEVKERVFEPFYTTRAQGTGLGLAVVQAVARAHGGAAWLESRQGEGSAFGLRLPINQSSVVSRRS